MRLWFFFFLHCCVAFGSVELCFRRDTHTQSSSGLRSMAAPIRVTYDCLCISVRVCVIIGNNGRIETQRELFVSFSIQLASSLDDTTRLSPIRIFEYILTRQHDGLNKKRPHKHMNTDTDTHSDTDTHTNTNQQTVIAHHNYQQLTSRYISSHIILWSLEGT